MKKLKNLNVSLTNRLCEQQGNFNSKIRPKQLRRLWSHEYVSGGNYITQNIPEIIFPIHTGHLADLYDHTGQIQRLGLSAGTPDHSVPDGFHRCETHYIRHQKSDGIPCFLSLGAQRGNADGLLFHRVPEMHGRMLKILPSVCIIPSNSYLIMQYNLFCLQINIIT